MKNTPYPSVAFTQQIENAGIQILSAVWSGELKASTGIMPLGAARFDGRVKDVWVTANGSGRDDSNILSVSTDVYINGVSCLTTTPVISGEVGSASRQKTTKTSDDVSDGCRQAVINTSADSFDKGDMFTYKFTLTRTATPTTEMNNLCVVVELYPEAAPYF